MSQWGGRERASCKECLAAGGIVAGVISPFASPSLVRSAAAAGFAAFIADGEHGSFEPKDLEPLAAAAEASGVDLIVRTPGVSPLYISRSLDAGAAGVIIPHGSADTARAAVAACRYPPEGMRGVGPAFANYFGVDLARDGFSDSVNRRTLVIIQIEDVAAVSAISEIAATDGVDGLLVGPRDLSYSLKAEGVHDIGAVEQAIDATVTAARAAGKWAALPAADPAAARAVAGRGVRFVLAYLPQLIATAGAAFVESAAR